MIVRILGEGQFELPDESMERLNELDDSLEAALDDEQSFSAALTALLEGVRVSGSRVADEDLVTSDVVLPAAESTVDEVRALLTDEGLIPD
jgi:hypothetical protein